MENDLLFPTDVHRGNASLSIPLFPGMEMSYLTLRSNNLVHRHSGNPDILEINYCRVGRLGWRMSDGSEVFLGPGDYSLHTMADCAESVMILPNGFYEGISIRMDCTALDTLAPGIFGGAAGSFSLRERFRAAKGPASFAGNEESESVFCGFWNQPPELADAYRRVKFLELLLFFSKTETRGRRLTEYRAEQIAIIHAVHDELLHHMDSRITIDQLAKKFCINPTTLKNVFKSVYGNSIAAHVKEHRMERAAQLLNETDLSVAEIAQAVGYDSQSRFSDAFRETYQLLPTEYRTKN